MTLGLSLKGASARLSRVWRDEIAATAIEFALIAPIFLAIVLATIQVFVVWFVKTELQSATETAARLVFTQNSGATASAATFQTALCNQIPALINCNAVMINLTDVGSVANLTSSSTATPSITYDKNGNAVWGGSFTAGSGGDVMVLQTAYLFPVIAGPLFSFGASQYNGNLLLISTVVFQNEPQ